MKIRIFLPLAAIIPTMSHSYYVYILANRGKMIYTGVTSDLPRRVFEHRNGTGSKYTSKHGISDLVWFDETNEIESALIKEKQIKNWRRQWKVNLVEKGNLYWDDLARDWYDK